MQLISLVSCIRSCGGIGGSQMFHGLHTSQEKKLAIVILLHMMNSIMQWPVSCHDFFCSKICKTPQTGVTPLPDSKLWETMKWNFMHSEAWWSIMVSPQSFFLPKLWSMQWIQHLNAQKGCDWWMMLWCYSLECRQKKDGYIMEFSNVCWWLYAGFSLLWLLWMKVLKMAIFSLINPMTFFSCHNWLFLQQDAWNTSNWGDPCTILGKQWT